MFKKFITEQEAMRMLNNNFNNIRLLRRQGKIKGTKICGYWMYEYLSCRAFLKQKKAPFGNDARK